MTHESIKVAFSDAVHHVASNISSYAADSDKDLIRNRKIGKRLPSRSTRLSKKKSNVSVK